MAEAAAQRDFVTLAYETTYSGWDAEMIYGCARDAGAALVGARAAAATERPRAGATRASRATTAASASARGATTPSRPASTRSSSSRRAPARDFGISKTKSPGPVTRARAGP